MNSTTESAECLHGMCSACTYEDCACGCHLQAMLDADAERTSGDAYLATLSENPL